MAPQLRVSPLRSGGLRISLATKRPLYRALLLSSLAAAVLCATVQIWIYLARSDNPLVLVPAIFAAIATVIASFFALRACALARTHVDVRSGQLSAVYGIYRLSIAATSIAAVDADPLVPDLPNFKPGVRVITLSGTEILVFPGLPDVDRENAARVLREELRIADDPETEEFG